jgi:arylsulfatase A-like enzyme
VALRTEKWLYVEYLDGTRTLYDREADPSELVNLMPVADPALVAQLAGQKSALAACAGSQCRVADMMPVVGETPTLPVATPTPTPTPEPSPSPSN